MIMGCECDSICESHKATKAKLKSYSSDSELVSFLQTYNGEGPGSEKFAVFVAWGVDNPSEFISILNHQDISEHTLSLISYTISEIGYSKEYCAIYDSAGTGRNVASIRNAILGCTNNAL